LDVLEEELQESKADNEASRVILETVEVTGSDSQEKGLEKELFVHKIVSDHLRQYVKLPSPLTPPIWIFFRPRSGSRREVNKRYHSS
jgi:hypothetical protein